MARPSPAPSFRPSGGVVAFAFAWVVAQVTIPLWQLREPRPARWGWQMYSVTVPHPVMSGIRENGDRVRLRASTYLAHYRFELTDYADRLAATACRVKSGLVAVEVQPHDAPRPRRYPCVASGVGR
jgi:hypothetical protein